MISASVNNSKFLLSEIVFTLIADALVLLMLNINIFSSLSLRNKLKTFVPEPGLTLSAVSIILGSPINLPSAFNFATAAYTVVFTWN